MDDEALRQLQIELTLDLEKGKLIKGGGGLRKIRVADSHRGKGKRGGLRVIYYLQQRDDVLYLVFVYSKDVSEDLTPKEMKILQ
ncbi:MAG: type II toxin-antitoxin system RelE/ParE family toxin [Trueperaceae bacterium]